MKALSLRINYKIAEAIIHLRLKYIFEFKEMTHMMEKKQHVYNYIILLIIL